MAALLILEPIFEADFLDCSYGFRPGRLYPAVPFRQVNSYTVLRLTQHLTRRSQRGFRPPKGESYYSRIYEFGLVYLR